MIIKLTKEEEQNLVISKVLNKQLPSDYIRDRDEAWDGMVEEGAKVGKKFWNGKLYSFEGFVQTEMNNPTIYLGEMEYKDRLFKKKVGTENIIKKYGQKSLLIHCGASVEILTKDKKFLVGRTRMSVGLQKLAYGHVSGNLNIDELEINSMQDIYKTILKEMNEEIPIKVDIDKLKFNQINIFNTYCNFDFIYQSEIMSKDVSALKPTEEFESFEALSLNEILNLKEKGISDFEFSKRYLEEIISK